MATLEQEIIEKFHQLDKMAQRRVRALIERETEEPVDNEALSSTQKRESWIDFINATYGSLADDPLEEIDNSHLPPPVRDEVE
ncbi:MAG: hypothetical protein HUU31_14470 [Anaerolineae bacterium]|nr:hypothetical protein [Anaerolineae bacterium]